MRCGKCRTITDSIDHVRSCYGVTQSTGPRPAPVVQERRPVTTAIVARSSADSISEKQKSYMLALFDKKGVSEDEVSDRFGFVVTDCYKDEAREVISWLLTLPEVKTAEAPMPDVPAGRYALMVPGSNVYKFYRVDKPTEGRWAGRTFVSVMASDEAHPLRDPAARRSVLEAIAADPRAASLAYGREIGSCGVCGRTLTDAESIAAGIGPICSAKMGW